MIDNTQVKQPLFSRLGADPDLGEIVEMFVAELPQRVTTFLTQCDARDWASLRRTAHQLKGAAGSYGFDPITPFAARVESALIENEPEEQIRQAVAELAAICRCARAGAPCEQ